jgi:hypothetical protein
MVVVARVNDLAASHGGWSWGRYRWRTELLKRLPYRLLWLAPKGRSDRGAHDWQNHDGDSDDDDTCLW